MNIKFAKRKYRKIKLLAMRSSINLIVDHTAIINKLVENNLNNNLLQLRW
jgi:hypothetical protein